MQLLAYRPEYRIYIEVERNHLVYERLEELTLASELPYYLHDIARALRLVQPGFTLLSDLRRTLGPNLNLLPLFCRSSQLLLEAEIGMVVELHSQQPSMRHFTHMLRQNVMLPTQQFTNPEAAEAFLESFRLRMAG